MRSLRSNTLLAISSASLIICTLIAVTSASTWYVDSEHGSDTNAGNDPSAAFRTLAHASSNMDTKGGDTLSMAGQFMETLALLNINTQADPGRQTVVESTDPANPASIYGGTGLNASAFPYDCRGLPEGFGPGQGGYLTKGVTVTNSNYFTLQNVVIEGIAGLGLQTWNTSHVAVLNVTVQWLSNTAMQFHHGGPTKPSAPFMKNLTLAGCTMRQMNLAKFTDREKNPKLFSIKAEALSIIHVDGVSVHHNQLLNGMMEGIDLKEGTKNGVVHNNLVSATRSAGIYLDEVHNIDAYQNIIRWVGYHDPEDGSGIQQACTWMKTKGIVLTCYSSGILINVGDLLGGIMTGRESNVRVFQNVVHDIWRYAFTISNAYRVGEKHLYWELDNNTIFNNVFASSGYRPPFNDDVLFDIGCTHTKFFNNIIIRGKTGGVSVWAGGANITTRQAFWNTAMSTNNLFWQNGANNVTNGWAGNKSTTADPLFARVPSGPGDASGDFELTAPSPAIRAGAALAGCPPGVCQDIGAYAFGQPAWQVGPSAWTAGA